MDDERATLAWCNEWRAREGREPLREMPKNTHFFPRIMTCPVAQAIDAGVKVYETRGFAGTECVPLPNFVVRQVKVYDRAIMKASGYPSVS